MNKLNVKKVVASIDDFKQLEAEIFRQKGRITEVKGVYHGLQVYYELNR